MRWTERQQTLLREIGVRLWLPDTPGEVDAARAGLDAAMPAPGGTEDDAPGAARAGAPAPARAALPAPEPRPEPGLPTAPAVDDLVRAAARSPEAARVAALDWPALREAVAGCRACGLCDSRRQTVFGVGHAQAHCMVVGEAPGEQEDRVGEPFVGPAGQLLDRMLAALGLTRGAAEPARQVYIANTLKCRPPRNRNPSPEELAACQPYLERQVALVQPRVILAMGRFAVQSLLGSDEALGRLRGRLHRWNGVPLVVTYHPAYLLRQPADKARAWDDLCLAASCLDGAP